MRRVRLFVLTACALLLSGLACTSGDSPTAVPDQAEPSMLLGGSGGLLGTGLGASLLACDPLPSAQVSRRVGPEGGVLQVGPHTLVIPAGALPSPVVISAESPSEPVSSVELQPEGLVFARGKPARLTMSYANCPLLGRLLPKQIAYTDDRLRILALLPSLDDPLARRVSADLEHFSRYAVAW